MYLIDFGPDLQVHTLTSYKVFMLELKRRPCLSLICLTHQGLTIIYALLQKSCRWMMITDFTIFFDFYRQIMKKIHSSLIQKRRLMILQLIHKLLLVNNIILCDVILKTYNCILLIFLLYL